MSSLFQADIAQRKQTLKQFARTIDPLLKKQLASYQLLKHLRSDKNNVHFLVILVCVIVTWSAWQLSWLLGLVAGIAMYAIYRRFPRLFLSSWSLCLMRYEGPSHSEEHPMFFTQCPAPSTDLRFGESLWADCRVNEVGDIVVGIFNAKKEGIAIIHLRDSGKIPITSWLSNYYEENALPPLGEEVKQKALEFSDLCDSFWKIKQNGDQQLSINAKRKTHVDTDTVWQGVFLEDRVKQELIQLAQHFDQQSPAASQGLLLHGPPGTGKTLIAKKLAETIQCAFFPLNLAQLKAGYVGQSGQQVRNLWQRALGEPQAVIFIDECESVFGRRGSATSDSFTEEIVQTFLAEWDGFSKQRTVWVVGATNRRDLIDEAIRSRFGEEIAIELPKGPQRLAILAKELRNKGVSNQLPPEAEELTQGMSGRDLENVAGRLVRQHRSDEPIPQKLLEKVLGKKRRQGSTMTDASATWDKLILPSATLKTLKHTTYVLAHADSFTQQGITIPRGILLYGPPGTGKTQIARTIAQESGLAFVGASTTDLKANFLGQSANKVRELFERVRSMSPCVLFIDELDVVAPPREQSTHDTLNQEIVGQLLQELDGIKSSDRAVFLLAATNHLDRIDAAVLSRFPTRLAIGLPNQAARFSIIKVLLSSKPHQLDDQECLQLAAQTDGYSGRDLRNWCELAEQSAVARAIEDDQVDQIKITFVDFSNQSPDEASR